MPAYITGLDGGSSGWFVDQNGNPRLYWSDENWGLPANAGRWNGGNYQLDYDNYHAARAAQGFTGNFCHPWGHTHTGCNNDAGNTWDGVSPWSGGVPTLNSTFWTRIDYMFTSAAAQGITVFFDLTMKNDNGTGAFAGTGVWNGVSLANIQAAAQNIAARYLSTPNLIWMYGDDTNSDDEDIFAAVLAGIQAAGDTRPLAVEYYATGTTSREDLSGSPTSTPFTFGGANATFNLCYYYEPVYFAIEQAYQENNQIPVIWGDGFFYGDASTSAENDRLMRNMAWWALSSGARGCTMGSDAVFQWSSTSYTAVTSEGWYVNSALKVRTVIESLTGWNKLLPDTGSALVTGGRGTRAGYSNQFYLASTDTYVSASRVPDGTLALIYMSKPTTITIDPSQMAAGYGVKWIDPYNGAVTTGTPGTTYNSTAKGSNAAGATDWALALVAPPNAAWTVP